MTELGAIVEKLRSLVDEALEQAGQEPLDPAVGDGVFLPDVLDSVVLVALIASIEEEWGIEIDESAIDVDNFSDLRSIARVVEVSRPSKFTDDG